MPQLNRQTPLLLRTILVASLLLDIRPASARMRNAVPLDPAAARTAIQHRGIGLGVRVSEVDGTNVRGIITAIHGDTFDVAPRGGAEPVSVPFAQLAAIHNDGNSTTAKIGKGLAIGGLVFAVSIVVIFVVVVAANAH